MSEKLLQNKNVRNPYAYRYLCEFEFKYSPGGTKGTRNPKGQEACTVYVDLDSPSCVYVKPFIGFLKFARSRAGFFFVLSMER